MPLKVGELSSPRLVCGTPFLWCFFLLKSRRALSLSLFTGELCEAGRAAARPREQPGRPGAARQGVPQGGVPAEAIQEGLPAEDVPPGESVQNRPDTRLMTLARTRTSVGDADPTGHALVTLARPDLPILSSCRHLTYIRHISSYCDVQKGGGCCLVGFGATL